MRIVVACCCFYSISYRWWYGMSVWKFVTTASNVRSFLINKIASAHKNAHWNFLPVLDMDMDVVVHIENAKTLLKRYARIRAVILLYSVRRAPLHPNSILNTKTQKQQQQKHIAVLCCVLCTVRVLCVSLHKYILYIYIYIFIESMWWRICMEPRVHVLEWLRRASSPYPKHVRLLWMSGRT